MTTDKRKTENVVKFNARPVKLQQVGTIESVIFTSIGRLCNVTGVSRYKVVTSLDDGTSFNHNGIDYVAKELTSEELKAFIERQEQDARERAKCS